MGITDDRNDPELKEVDPVSGMQKAYLVLSVEERAKGFVRPLRHSYTHVGPPKPKGKLRDLTDEEKEKYEGFGYAKFEEYPEDRAVLGTYWTQERLNRCERGFCNCLTTMGESIAETYARDPRFYGSTYCAACRAHFPVNEFIWFGTKERVGT